MFWPFVFLVNSREALNLPGPGLLVQSLDVSLFANLKRSVHKALNKDQVGVIVNLSGHFSVSCEWTDKACQRDCSAVGKETGDFSNTADILLSVVLAEAKVRIEAMSDVVTVQCVGVNIVSNEIVLHGK